MERDGQFGRLAEREGGDLRVLLDDEAAARHGPHRALPHDEDIRLVDGELERQQPQRIVGVVPLADHARAGAQRHSAVFLDDEVARGLEARRILAEVHPTVEFGRELPFREVGQRGLRHQPVTLG